MATKMTERRKRLLGFALAAAMTTSASPASAGALNVRIVDAEGRPVGDAVVTLKPANGTAPKPKVERGYQVIQRNMQFRPFVSVVPVGGAVAFPNLDALRHHVYSFSKAKRFELKLFAKDQSRSVIFDRPGVVAIGCNIHDRMSAYIFVTDTVWTARSAANGAATFRDTPAGAYVIQVWHPYLRAPGGILSRTISSGADRSESFKIGLRPPPMHHTGGYR